MLSKEEISKIIKGPESMYRACLANQFFMAPRNSPINTNAFMLELYNGTVILPKANEVRNFNCLNPPSRTELVNMITEIIEICGNYDSEELK